MEKYKRFFIESDEDLYGFNVEDELKKKQEQEKIFQKTMEGYIEQLKSYLKLAILDIKNLSKFDISTEQGLKKWQWYDRKFSSNHESILKDSIKTLFKKELLKKRISIIKGKDYYNFIIGGSLDILKGDIEDSINFLKRAIFIFTLFKNGDTAYSIDKIKHKYEKEIK